MSDLIVGDRILKDSLIKNGKPENLKNSSYNLTIGKIVPIGKEAYKKQRKSGLPEKYFIEPREVVLVLSEESFQLPEYVTGLVTLRTALTKVGLQALDVGIVDPHYSGPISTTLINFSDRPFEIRVGDPFFRVLFLLHDDVSEWRPKIDESIDSELYIKNLERTAYNKFPKTYLNLPSNDDEFFFRNFWRMIRSALTYGWIGKITGIILIILIWFILEESTFVPLFSGKI
ncbi:MAG: hypothetical protein L3J37_11800 [Rhodobacteraceae bacterium]|nr:hypothetical protein [Paracoccaceae bacterium]